MTFVVGERILCYHGPKLYEAKILKVDASSGTEQFLVHYQGWKSKWDEWVTAVRIVHYDDNGLGLQKSLAAIHVSADDRAVDKEDGGKPEMTVIFKLTKNFKRYANADWIMVTKRGKILTAPVKFSAADFLRQYAGNQTDESASVFVCNFIRLLDVAIGKTLLYQQERLHYASLDKSPGAAALYGPEVLIRFFARLNIILQDYSGALEVGAFSNEFGRIAEHLHRYLSTHGLEASYVGMGDQCREPYSIN